MRDAFGEIDPDEIDIIDADPLAFGPLDRSTTSADDPAPLSPRRRRWLVPVAVGGTAALSVAAVAVTLLVWQPWEKHGGIKVPFPSATAATAALTDELVFTEPPADLTAATLGDVAAGEPGGLSRLQDAVGYLFGEPGASFGTGRGGTGRWAVFYAVPAESQDAKTLSGGDGAATVTVQGAPGLLTTSIGSRTIEINFGPLGGYTYSVITSELSQAESLALAQAVSLDDGTPVVNDSTVLGHMRPLGSIADFATVFGLVLAIGEPGLAQPGIVSAQYGTDGKTYSVTSHPADAGALTMVSFLFGAGEGATVHGQPALAFEIDPADPLLAFGSGSGTVVAWIEGGRLVIVTGPDGPVTTTALAESVRPATDAEWAEVVRAAANTVDPTSQVAPSPDVGAFAALDSGVDEVTGVAYTFRAKVAGAQLSTCIGESTRNGENDRCNLEQPAELPLLTTEDWNGHVFVLAVVAADVADNPELRFTLADGTAATRPLDDVGDALPGPATGFLLPDDAGTVELWNGGVRVATMSS